MLTNVRKESAMPRPVRCRRIEHMPVYRSFSPDDITADESVRMTVDEYEDRKSVV